MTVRLDASDVLKHERREELCEWLDSVSPHKRDDVYAITFEDGYIIVEFYDNPRQFGNGYRIVTHEARVPVHTPPPAWVYDRMT